MRDIQGAEGATQSLNYVGGPSGAPSESSYCATCSPRVGDNNCGYAATSGQD